MSRLVAKIEIGNKLNGARARNGWRCSHTRGRTYKRSANVKSANRRDTRCLEIASGQMYHSRGWNSLFSSKKKKKEQSARIPGCIRNVFESETFFEKSLLKFSTANVCERLERRFVIFTLATCVEDVGNPREGS